MEKTSGVLELVLERIKQYGPQSAMIGAGLAGLSHYLYSNREEEEDGEKKEDDAVYVDVPEKSAAEISQYLLDSGIGGGAILGSGVAGYLVLDKILKSYRSNKIKSEIEKTKAEYAKLLTQRINKGEDEEEKEASIGRELTYPNIEALCYAVAIVNEGGDEKVAEISDPSYLSIATSMPSLAALVGGVLAHNYWYDRQKNIEAGVKKKEVEESKKTPIRIRLRGKKEEHKEKEDGETDDKEKVGNASPLTEDEADILNVINGNFGKEEEKNDKSKDDEVDMTIRDSMVEPIDHNTTVIHTETGDTVIEAQDRVAVKVMERAQDIISKTLAMTENLD